MKTFISFYSHLLFKKVFVRFLLAGLIALSVFFGYQLTQVQFDYEFDRLFPENDPETERYKEHVADFGENVDFLYLLISDSGSIFRDDFMSKVRNYERSILSDPMVNQTVSPVSMQKFTRTIFGSIPIPLLSMDSLGLKRDSAFVFQHPFYRQFFGMDRKSLFIYLSHVRAEAPKDTDAMLGRIKELALQGGLENFQVIGPAEAQSVFISFIQQDFTRFLVASVLVCFTLLMLIFRDIRSALLPFLISVVSVVWLFGMLVTLGIKMNLLTVLLPPIVFFVAMSDVIHLMNSFKKSGLQDKPKQLEEAFKVAWKPTLLTSVTTAIGFLSLLWINTEPIQEMGLLAALGVLIAFLVTYTLGAVYIAQVKIKNYTGVGIPSGYAGIVKRRKRAIIWITTAFILITIPGALMIENNAFILDDLPRDAEVRVQFANADQQIGGVKTFELRVELVNETGSFKDKMILDELNKIHAFLRDSIGVARLQSPVTPLMIGHSITHSSSIENFSYPESDSVFLIARKSIDGYPDIWQGILSKDQKAARIFGSLPDQGTERSKRDYARVISFVESRLNMEIIQVYPTGATYLIDITNDRLSGNLLKGLASAVIIIAIFLGLFFRSWKLMLISLIPNLIPLLVIAGIVGWVGISLKMTSAIIFTVAFGIAVDDTIHFMSYYMQNLSKPDPMEVTFRHAGSAMLITTLIMMAGFGLFMLSAFGATFTMGLFVSLALLVALIVDFTLLPLIMEKVLRK